jgi:hypothetical protein
MADTLYVGYLVLGFGFVVLVQVLVNSGILRYIAIDMNGHYFYLPYGPSQLVCPISLLPDLESGCSETGMRIALLYSFLV